MRCRSSGRIARLESVVGCTRVALVALIAVFSSI